jgi:nicotinic acid phosphoribosyltransferase
MSDSVDFNLDTYALEKKANFAFVFKGRRIELSDPNMVDWKILAEMEAPVELLRHVTTSEEDRKFLRDNPMPIILLKEVMDRFARHFGLPEMGKGAGSVI